MIPKIGVAVPFPATIDRHVHLSASIGRMQSPRSSTYAQILYAKPDLIGRIGDGQLYAMAMPKGGVYLGGNIDLLDEEGISLVISMLDYPESDLLGLTDESYLCKLHGIAFRRVPMGDGGTPPYLAPFLEALIQSYDEIVTGANAAVHCRAGIGRTSLFVAALLARHGEDPGRAFRRISAARGFVVPDTPEQAEWVFDNLDAIRSGISKL